MRTLTVYIAGKVSKESFFQKHHWRDEFCQRLEELSGRTLKHLDPLEGQNPNSSPEHIFAQDCQRIKQADGLVVYLSDDISVGGSQEILIAKYFKKPVIGFAPNGGKFNGSSRKMLGEHIENYKDPFVFSTCDVVCGTLEETAKKIKAFEKIRAQSLDELIKTSLSNLTNR